MKSQEKKEILKQVEENGYLLMTKCKFNLKKLYIKIKNFLWFKLVLGSNEFSPKLSLSRTKMMKMTKEERTLYVKDIMKKRQIAHELDI